MCASTILRGYGLALQTYANAPHRHSSQNQVHTDRVRPPCASGLRVAGQLRTGSWNWRLGSCFCFFDAHGAGKIHAYEMRAVFAEVVPVEFDGVQIGRLLQQLEVDDDGYVDIRTFCSRVCTMNLSKQDRLRRGLTKGRKTLLLESSLNEFHRRQVETGLSGDLRNDSSEEDPLQTAASSKLRFSQLLNRRGLSPVLRSCWALCHLFRWCE